MTAIELTLFIACYFMIGACYALALSLIHDDIYADEALKLTALWPGHLAIEMLALFVMICVAFSRQLDKVAAFFR